MLTTGLEEVAMATPTTALVMKVEAESWFWYLQGSER